jgi:S1-C subfamily serine protease
MIEAFVAIALGLAATTAGLAAGVDTSPVASPQNSLPSLAPILKKITPAVVHIAVRGRLPPYPTSRRREARDVHSMGSGVVLGITLDDPTPDVVRELKITAPPNGAVIVKVDPRSPGARAGLKSGDIVTEIGNRPVRDSAFLRNRLALLRVGDVAELGVLRDGKPLKIQATMAERDQRARAK